MFFVGQSMVPVKQLSDELINCNFVSGFFGMWHEDMKMMKYMCYKCNKSYKNRGTLIRHLRFECGVQAQFFCPLCNFACKQRYNLTLHLRRQHPNETEKVAKRAYDEMLV